MNNLHRNRICVLRVLPRRFRDAAQCCIAVVCRRAGAWRRSVVIVSLAFATAAHAATNVVLYTYDAVGNIVTMHRNDSAPIAIYGFTPVTGPSGVTVNVAGVGFAATATANTVTFNGVPATVTAATATALTVTVPAGAATGRIVVTAGGNTATSAQDFVVATPGVPTLTGLSPTAGPAERAASVTGASLTPDADTRLDGPIALPNGSIFRERWHSAPTDVDRTPWEGTP